MIKALSVTTRLLSVLAVAGAMAGVLAEPAAAQTASKLRCTGCVKSKNIKRTINLGSKNGKDGNFAVLSSSRQKNVVLDGDTGNVTNSFTGNGLIKAWARINADGTVASCWRCSMDPTKTRKVSTGQYFVDFTPLSTDIRERPVMSSVHSPIPNSISFRRTIASTTPFTGDPSMVHLRINLDDATPIDGPFAVAVY